MKYPPSEAKFSNVVSLCSARTKLRACSLAQDEYISIAKTNPYHIQIVYNFVDWVAKEIKAEDIPLLASLVGVLPAHSHCAVSYELEKLQELWIGELPQPVLHMILLMKLIEPAIEMRKKTGRYSNGSLQ